MKFYNTIFATPIIELDVKINNKKIINYIKKIQKYSSGRVVSNEGGWQSEDLNPNLDILKPLTKHIIESSIEFAKNCKFKPGKYSVSNLWANINNYKDSNGSHVHQFCMLSGVYYLKTPKNSGNLVLNEGAGKILINSTTSLGTGRQLQINATSAYSYSGISLGRFANDTSNSGLDFVKSRSATVGGNTIVQSGDSIGAIIFKCADGNDLLTPAAEIRGDVDGTPGANDMPGRIRFSTTADGSNSLTELARMTSTRNLLLSQTDS